MPGLVVDVLSPPAHIKLSGPPQTIQLRANVTMMCGCPLAPDGLWDAKEFEIRAIVKRDGKPVPFAEVEVEFYNEGRRVPIPNDAFVTQVIKADAGGVFSYTMPKAGWWGFAALVDGDEKLENPQGEAVDVELGGLIWVKTVDME